ncbi:MAG: OmpA family protein, partial [Bacteroidia bacterium]|nr:OmpA family protein [Bacteroidia bacterium]
PLPKTINTKHREPSACFSYDGKTIYFVSNKPGGYGGRDIYKSTLDKKGKWGKSQNLGAVINSPYDEEGIFMQSDGKTFYFSSKGHTTMGGYDIFKSLLVDGKWTEPENLGYPVNTPDDDVYFVISASGKHGYYASAKKGGVGEKDIYMITFLGPEKPLVLNTEDNLLASITTTISEALIEPVVEVKTSSITILKGVVQDAVTQKVLEAEIEIVDNDIGEVIASFASNSKTGKYLITLPSGKNYGIAVKAEGYLFHSENFDIKLSTEYQEIIKNVDLKRIAVGSNIVLRNIFFDFDKATLRPESKAELLRLIKLLNDVSSMRIEISGHTDSRGSDEYNEKLSHSRAKSVVDYLIKEGIKSSRLEYKGYGESQPLATNDTEEGRQFNRRTEFKILSK